MSRRAAHRRAKRASTESLLRHRRPVPFAQALVDVMPAWLAEGWEGRPCPVCGRVVGDWHDHVRYASVYTAEDGDNWGLHYPVCCDPPSVTTGEDPPYGSFRLTVNNEAMTAIEETVEAAYHLDDDPVPFWFGPTGPRWMSDEEVEAIPEARLWWPILPQNSSDPETIAKVTDRIWSHTHPGLRYWRRWQFPGEFSDRFSEEVPVEAPVLVHCMNLGLRLRQALARPGDFPLQ